jgi:hypothetical protein
MGSVQRCYETATNFPNQFCVLRCFEIQSATCHARKLVHQPGLYDQGRIRFSSGTVCHVKEYRRSQSNLIQCCRGSTCMQDSKPAHAYSDQHVLPKNSLSRTLSRSSRASQAGRPTSGLGSSCRNGMTRKETGPSGPYCVRDDGDKYLAIWSRLWRVRLFRPAPDCRTRYTRRLEVDGETLGRRTAQPNLTTVIHQHEEQTQQLVVPRST